jgi:hypothetical protein
VKRLEVHEAFVPVAYVMRDLPIRHVSEMLIRLYEAGYVLYAPDAEPAQTVEPHGFQPVDNHAHGRPYVKLEDDAGHFSVWHTAEDQCGGPFQGTSHEHGYKREGRG